MEWYEEWTSLYGGVLDQDLSQRNRRIGTVAVPQTKV